MAKYIVEVKETITKFIEVEADNTYDAIDEAENADDSKFFGHQFGANKVISFMQGSES